jgi:hypothetical protein
LEDDHIKIESNYGDYLYFKAQDRWIDFFESYIPKHLPEKPTPDKDGYLGNWQDTKEGYSHIIDFLVDDAIKTIMDRPEDKVLEFQLNRLKKAIDVWTKDWDREFALLALAYFSRYDISESTDAYMTLYPIAYPDNEKEPIESFKWISDKIDLSDALDTLQPLSHLFRDNLLEGFKMALSGSNIYDMEGCLAPSSGNQRAVLYLIYKLADNGLIQETGNMEETAKVLISPNCSYRREKSLFSKGEYTLAKPKENQIETLVDSLSKL